MWVIEGLRVFQRGSISLRSGIAGQEQERTTEGFGQLVQTGALVEGGVVEDNDLPLL